MTEPWDDPPGAPPRGATLRPRDAATLLLVRRRTDGWSVLMGRRSSAHAFMPEKWVFPGGRVDRGDSCAPAASELSPDIAERLGCVRRPPRALALAAIRETFEETGLVVGRPSSVGKAPAGWGPYAACGAAPELHKLSFIGRAITPPGRPRRFDARFFMADADEALLDDRPHAQSAELPHTQWLAFHDAVQQDLPAITRFMLKEAWARVEGREEPGAPFVRWERGRHRMDRT